MRVIDQQTNARRAAGFAAIIQALVAAVADEEPQVYDRKLYAQRQADAARLPPDSDEVAALAELVGPRRYASHVLAGRPEVERQLQSSALRPHSAS